jgi:glycosyltransferase involved in cell wall biosynthesis
LDEHGDRCHIYTKVITGVSKLRLVINSRFLTQSITGVQRYAHEISNELIKLGKGDVIVAFPQRINSENQQVIQAKCSASIKAHTWEQFVLPRYLNRLDADLLFSPCNTGPLSVSNQVVTIHDVSVIKRPEDYSKNFVKWYSFLLPRLARQAERIITVSEFSKKELAEVLKISPEKIATIYNGVGYNFKPQDQITKKKFIESRGLPKRYVLVLGSKIKRKNFLRLLKAWEVLTREEKMEDVSLIIAGGIVNKQDANIINQLAGRLPRTYDTGYIDNENLPQLYSCAEVFVYPSLYEGFGLPPLEAMACGTPVVVSNTASLPEVVGDAGIYIDPYNIEDIAEGIFKVITDKKLQNDLSEKGIKRAELFNWNNAARETYKVMEEAVINRRSKQICK